MKYPFILMSFAIFLILQVIVGYLHILQFRHHKVEVKSPRIRSARPSMIDVSTYHRTADLESKRRRSRLDIPDVSWNHYSHHLSSWYDITLHTKVWSTAHYEHRHFAYGEPAIIIMMYHRYFFNLPEIYLSFDNEDGSAECLTPKWVEIGKMIKIDLQVDYFYYAIFLLNNEINVPTSVRLHRHICSTVPLTPDMPVHYKPHETKIEFATCLHQGLTAGDNRTLEMASWIEIQRAIGVQHITIYNQNLSSSIIEMLREYEKEGFVEVIEWKLHNPKKRIGVNGQLCVINDCFYRNLRRSKYIMFVDLDEVIIPHKATNLHDMMESIYNASITQYRFYNSFWHDMGQLLPGGEKYIDNTNIPIHFKRTHRTKDCPPTTRFKNIIKADLAVCINVHTVFRKKAGMTWMAVPESVGLMHHYRYPDYAYNETKIEDHTLSRYIDQVMTKLIFLNKTLNDRL